jgi:hypothetical protein
MDHGDDDGDDDDEGTSNVKNCNGMRTFSYPISLLSNPGIIDCVTLNSTPLISSPVVVVESETPNAVNPVLDLKFHFRSYPNSFDNVTITPGNTELLLLLLLLSSLVSPCLDDDGVCCCNHGACVVVFMLTVAFDLNHKI